MQRSCVPKLLRARDLREYEQQQEQADSQKQACFAEGMPLPKQQGKVANGREQGKPAKCVKTRRHGSGKPQPLPAVTAPAVGCLVRSRTRRLPLLRSLGADRERVDGAGNLVVQDAVHHLVPLPQLGSGKFLGNDRDLEMRL